MPALRLLPILLFAAASLLALKTIGILAGSGYTLGGGTIAVTERGGTELGAREAIPRAIEIAEADGSAPSTAREKRSWAQEVLGFPEITGSVSSAGKPPAGEAAKTPTSAPSGPGEAGAGTRPREAPIALENRPASAPGEAAVLERLGACRQELEARGRELEIREGLLKAAEQRLEARMEELKGLEAQNETAGQRKNEADAARVKGLVTMYENMKAKDAARIFDRLEMRILLELATQINPRRMADILAAMTPEAAERLTGELASRGTAGAKPPAVSDLPKIEGRPRS